MPSGNVPTTPTSPTSPTAPNAVEPQNEHSSSKMQRQMSYDPTEYVQRARVTKAAPPKPAANPLQFVQMKPCNLFRSAQEQLKRAEEVKKVKEIVKEEPEDWQSNLDNWKSGRRKRVEHIIDRVVEAKKLELEEFDRNRKKSKTFSEMMEERESKGRKYSLPVVYNDDEDANDFNGLGYRANDTISGMSSVSEDYENQSVNSDNALESDKNRFIDGNSNHKESYRRDSESSPGFDDNTSNSTLSAASPDPVYSSSYNSNGSRIQTTTLTSNFSRASVEYWAEKHHAPPPPPSSNHLKPKPRLTPKIEGHLASYETKLNDSHADQDERNANVNADKIDLPKIDISSRRELFEKEQRAQFNRSIDTKKPIVLTENAQAPASIKERLSHLEKRNDEPKDVMPTKPNRYSGDFSGVRERFSHGENGQFVTIEPKAPKIDVPVVPLKERLMNLESSMVVTSETPTSNGKLEHRTKKMVEPKAIAFNKPEENNLKVIDNNNESTTSSPIHVDEASHHLKDDEDSGINSDDLQSSLASQQSQPQQVVEELVIRTKTVTAVMSSPPLSPRSEKPNEPVPAARKPEVMPRRQITPDLVKITSNLNLEDDLLQSQDEIDDEADNSVSLPNTSLTSTTTTTTDSTSIPKNFLNLTIKSVLVDSHDILKASTLSSPSSCTPTLVMENQSIERAISSGQTAVHNETDRIVVNNNHKPVENQNLTVDVEPVLTENTIKNNGANQTTDNIVANEIAIDASPSKRIYQNIATHSNNNQSDQSDQMLVSNIQTAVAKNKSQTVDTVDGGSGDCDQNQQQRESIQLKNERIKCQIVGVLEKNKIDVAAAAAVAESNSNENQSPILPPKFVNKSPCKSPSKTKNIFDFIKRNLLNESTPTATTTANTEPIDNETVDQGSHFFVSLHEAKQSSEIDQLLDEEMEKLNEIPPHTNELNPI